MIILSHVRYEDTCRAYFTVKGSQGPFTHIRLNIFPDGGVARYNTISKEISSRNRKKNADVSECVYSEWLYLDPCPPPPLPP